MRAWTLAALCGWLMTVISASAVAADCVLSAPGGAWPSISGGVANGCSATDDFTIPSGSTVTITGDLIAPASANQKITVEDGGILIQENHRIVWGRGRDAENAGTPISNVSAVIDVLAGGTYEAHGCYRTADQYDPSCDAELIPSDHSWRVSQVSHVDGNILLSYDVASESQCTAASQAGCSNSISSHAAIRPANADAGLPGDLVVPLGASRAAGLFFEVLESELSGSTLNILLAARQTTEGSNDYAKENLGYPLQRKRIQTVSLVSSVEAGDLCVEVADGVISEVESYRGRSLMDVESGQSYVIMKTSEDIDCDGFGTAGTTGIDSIRILNEEGFEEEVGGSVLSIGYGWSVGDEFLVISPARVINHAPSASAGADETRGSIVVKGTLRTTAFAPSRVGSLVVVSDTGTSSAHWDECQDVFFRDSGARNTQTVRIEGVATGINCTRLLFSGGRHDPRAEGSGAHGVVFSNSPVLYPARSGPFECDQCAGAFHQDDLFVYTQGPSSTDPETYYRYGRLTLTRVRCMFVNDHAYSASCLDSNVNVDHEGGSIEDMVLLAGSQIVPADDSSGGSAGPALTVAPIVGAEQFMANRVAHVAARNSGIMDWRAASGSWRNFYVAGSDVDTLGAYMIGSLEDSYIRDFRFRQFAPDPCAKANGLLGQVDARTPSDPDRVFFSGLKRVRIKDAVVNSRFAFMAKAFGGLILESNVIQRLRTDCDTADTTILKVFNGSPDDQPVFEVTRNTFTWDDQEPYLWRFMINNQSSSAANQGAWRFDGNVFSGARGTLTVASTQFGSYINSAEDFVGFSSYERNAWADNECDTCAQFVELSGASFHPASTLTDVVVDFDVEGAVVDLALLSQEIGTGPAVAGLKMDDAYLWSVLGIPDPSVAPAPAVPSMAYGAGLMAVAMCSMLGVRRIRKQVVVQSVADQRTGER